MKTKCIHCGSDSLIKNGKPNGKQRWLCKKCGKNTLEGKEHSIKMHKRIIKAYLRGVGIRAIADIEEVAVFTVVYWIRKISNMVMEKQNKKLKQCTEIEILEMDELWTYVGKKTKDQER